MPVRPWGADLLVDVERGPGRPPLHVQLHRALVAAIGDGRLPAGARLPSTRQLAADLRVSRGAVVAVYARLADEGHVAIRPGSGARVLAPAAPQPSAPVPAGLPSPPVHDLRPGAPDLTAFPRAAWGAATTSVLRGMVDSDLGYAPPWGDPVLRRAIAAHVARTRQALTPLDDVIITSGTTQALTLTCRVLVSRGHTALAVEDPSNAVQRQVLSRYGLDIVNVPVDDEGLDVAALRRTGARAVLVTPAHQFPCGVALSRDRRDQLVDWAEDVDGVIVEDDYDAEFSFGGLPTTSLRARAPEHVVHTASVSKTLAPGVRLGWLVPPRRLLTDLLGAKRDDDFGTGVLTQRTLAHLMETGGYYRHVRRRRAQYRRQRRALVAGLAEQLPDWTVRGADAGLHLWLEAPPGTDEAAVVDAAAARAVLVLGMSAMRRLPGPPGLVLGYARLRPHRVDDAVGRLRSAVRDVAARQRRRGARPRRPLPGAALAARLGTSAVDYFPLGLTPGVEAPLVDLARRPTGTPAGRAAARVRHVRGSGEAECGRRDETA